MKKSKTGSAKSSESKASKTAEVSPVKKSSKTQVEPTTMEALLADVGYGFKGFKKGQFVSGTVSSISGKEVLIDFGGKTEGVVGEKEWEDVKGFVSKLKPGDKIEAMVISSENDRGQMVVSIRSAGNKFRWQRVKELLKSGDAVNVRGMEVNKGGILVDYDGLKGFMPGSQLAPEHASDMAKLLNRIIPAKVIEVDQQQNRLIFSEKAVTGAADLSKKLDEVKSKVNIGEKYKGKISAIMPYGVFVNLEAGPDGLVHISEISWEKVDNLAGIFEVGEQVDVLVLGINENDGKLNLSIKQLLPDPWADLAKKYSTDKEVKGIVTRVSAYGVFVKLEDGVEGLIHISKVPAGTEYEVGETVKCTIESVDVKSHRISLIPVVTHKPIGYK